MTIKKNVIFIIALVSILFSELFADKEMSLELDPVVVSADFRDKKLSQTAESLSVIGEEELYDKSSQSFVDILSSTPNLNFSSGGSKAKYIQIRGIGERSQFITPMNPSVGVILDGIEFSRNTLGLTLFDVQQIEVLRGPQGTTFGANGLAGVINVTSNIPTKETTGHIEATVGNYNTKAFGVALGGTLLEDKLLGRISIYKNSSDGFMENSFLGRKDTNNIDELSTKAQLRWLIDDGHIVDLNLIHTNIDNGYDAFTLDNSRISHADEPGKDTQTMDAFSVRAYSKINEKMHLVSSLSMSRSDSEYSYDEDWSYKGAFAESLYPYSSFDQYLRDRKQTNMDVRLVSDEDGRLFNSSTDWTVGLYYRDQYEALTRNYTYLDTSFDSEYQSDDLALYGQLDSAMTDRLTLTTGLRLEKWKARYIDSDKINIGTDEVLSGGKIGLNYQADKSQLYYISLSKGFKPGGVNADNSLSADAREYQTETLWNVDLGLNSHHFNNKLNSRLNFFYGKRQDQQVKSSVVETRKDGSTDYRDYLANAAKGHYYGMESTLDYYPTDSIHLFSNVGLLKAKFDDYVDPNPSSINMNGRAPAQSPEYQYSIGGDIMLFSSLVLKANIEGRGSYYFSNRHNAKADAYRIFNSSLEYNYDDWTASFWVRNITDEEYQVRGFGSFGNNPRNAYAIETYTQQGLPRTIGLTLSRDF